jgi:hypothetical protein
MAMANTLAYYNYGGEKFYGTGPGVGVVLQKALDQKFVSAVSLHFKQ